MIIELERNNEIGGLIEPQGHRDTYAIRMEAGEYL